MPATSTAMIDAFVERWAASGAAERANYQLFLSELCDVLDVPRPQPQLADDTRNAYVFEKPVPLPHGTTGRIDLYKRGCFVLEAKQGSDAWGAEQKPGFLKNPGFSQPRRRGTATRGTATWDTAMERAREQAQSYVRNLPPAELNAAASGGRPPFLIVVDVGATLELYSEFTRTGGAYLAFPDPQHHRIKLEDLRDPDVRALLATVWSEPLSLDPARRSARVTRTIAAQLAALARSLEAQHAADAVAHFLMRCLFTMFAEDVGLLPNRSFTQLLADLRHDVASFPPMIEHLWRTMDTGGFSVILRTQIPRFNGELFAAPVALPLDAAQLQLLSEAARADWRDVEPAIFGTLLERALDPVERHKLGAHYTPRAYVERLVQPTVVEPLRQEWDSVKTAALLLQEQGNTGLAIVVVEDFLRKLAHIRVLDPACGTANFLYVTMEHLKRLEAEVLQVRRELGQAQMTLEMESVQVTPQQFLGIELNPRAAAIAELVLWIGFLQWHFRTRGNVQPAEPIVRAFHNIECRDAVLAWDSVEPLLDASGNPVTRWDGRTLKRHPVTGEDVPDEQARVPVLRYRNPRPATWPAADFVVGNPPFLGTARMREALGDGYTEALRKVYPAVPDSADYVMYWWEKAAELVRTGALQRFGLITTNSLRQTFNRRVLERHLHTDPPLSLRFAIPDHPWVDTADGAAVRIAMTVASAGTHNGQLLKVASEFDGANETSELTFTDESGRIFADLTMTADVGAATMLRANQDISSRGTQLFGAGFIVTPEEAAALGYGTEPGLEAVIKPYRNGRDLTQTLRNMLVIDLFGLTEQEVRERYPAVYQHVYERVKPERDQNRRAAYRERWWIHGEPRANFRPALVGLNRYIATVETMRHRIFVFLDHTILPDNKLIAIAFDDAYFLGVLSSRFHVAWSLAAGSHLGIGNDPVYVKTACFEKFPFPAASEAQQARIRAIAERLDAHRKRQQARHPTLTLTDMYNVLERLRALSPNPDREGGAAAQAPSVMVGARIIAESSSTPYQLIPLAYFITFHTYGTWLPGDEEGSVDDAHNAPGTPMLPPDPRRAAQARDLMDQPAYTLDAPRRNLVLQAIHEVCAYRGWDLLAAHVRTNHVHVVVRADLAPEKAMTDFKAYASRKLNDAGLDQPERKRWTRHGSTRYIWSPAHMAAAINYVVHKQGAPMACYEDKERKLGAAPVENMLREARTVYDVTPLLELPVYPLEDVDEPEPARSPTVAARMQEQPPPLTPKERTIHEQGLVAVLRQLHDELDAAVADAYGWPADLPAGEILQRLVELNARRAAEEASGVIRWLRPEYQRARAGVAPVQATLVEEEADADVIAPAVAQPLPWPASMPEQARAVRGVLQQAVAPLTPAAVAACFVKADRVRVAELLETLASLGQAVEEEGRYGAV